MRRPRGRPESRTHTFPAPVRGWVENENLAANQGMGCSILENGFPLLSTVRVRGGPLSVADIGDPVVTLLPYRSGSVAQFFAVSENDIYDVSSFSTGAVDASSMPWPAAAAIWPAATETWLNVAPTAVATWLGQGGPYSYVQIDTGGGQFLVAANGRDPFIYYDGTNWNPVNDAAVNLLPYDALVTPFQTGDTVTGGTSGATATILGIQQSSASEGVLRLGAISSGPFANDETITSPSGEATANGASAVSSSVTVTGVDTADLSHLWMHANRIWGVEKDTMKAWFLPVDQIGGAAADFSLGGVFQQGGKLLFGASWSSDSGSGFGDRCVFVSDQGEIAVYQGTDPSDAATWTKVGLYDVGKPVSTQAVKAGGDLLVATTDGIVPLSAIVTKDPAALSMSAVSYPVEPAWKRVISTLPADDQVQLLKWQTQAMMIVGFPHRDIRETHVVNMQTGSWARWTGHEIRCMALHNDTAYFGNSDGKVLQFEAIGSDDGEVYTFRMSGLPDPLQAPGALKAVKMARATFRALAPFTARLSVATDYRRGFPNPPNASTESSAVALWDVGLWDVARFDTAPDSEERVTATTRWRSIGRNGVAIGPQVQIAFGAPRKPDAELVSFDLLYQVGGTVV